MSMWQINFLLLFSVLLACGERKPIEKFKGSYPIEEIEYDSPRIEVIPAKGAMLEDFVHINLLKTFKPGIIGNKAKKIFGEPDQENRGEYESIYEYWSDTARVEVHFGEDIFPSIEIFLKDKTIDNFLIPEITNYVKAKAEKGRNRLVINIGNAMDSSTMRIYLDGIELDYIEWTKIK